jgi:hypothetical protein
MSKNMALLHHRPSTPDRLQIWIVQRLSLGAFVLLEAGGELAFCLRYLAELGLVAGEVAKENGPRRTGSAMRARKTFITDLSGGSEYCTK